MGFFINVWPFNINQKKQKAKKAKRNKILLSTLIPGAAIIGGGITVFLMMTQCGGNFYSMTPFSVESYMQKIEDIIYQPTVVDLQNDNNLAFNFLKNVPFQALAYGWCQYYLLPWAYHINDDHIKIAFSLKELEFKITFKKCRNFDAGKYWPETYNDKTVEANIGKNSYVKFNKTANGFSLEANGRITFLTGSKNGFNVKFKETSLFNLDNMFLRYFHSSNGTPLKSNESWYGGFYKDNGILDADSTNDPIGKKGFVFLFDSSVDDCIFSEPETKLYRYKFAISTSAFLPPPEPITPGQPVVGNWEWFAGGWQTPNIEDSSKYKNYSNLDDAFSSHKMFAFFIDEKQIPSVYANSTTTTYP